eukprot:5545583-Amphidinium_carterae.1
MTAIPSHESTGAGNADEQFHGGGAAERGDVSRRSPRSTKRVDLYVQKLHEKFINTLDAALTALQKEDCWLRNRIMIIFGFMVEAKHSQDAIAQDIAWL